MSSFTTHLPALFLVGLIVVLGYYFGKEIKLIKLPAVIGYMILGVIFGPSLFNIVGETTLGNLSFITNIALGFVAFSIGLELNMNFLKKLGSSIVYIIIIESLAAFGLVFGGIYLITGNAPMALIFGALAPASAPAGTVAVIKEYKAHGDLTKALYAVVGFDDGFGIIIFGFTAALVKFILHSNTGHVEVGLFQTILHPIVELGISVVVGIVFGGIFSWLTRKLNNSEDIIILLFGFIFMASGASKAMKGSLIFTNMVMGFLIINTQPRKLTEKVHDKLHRYLPILFILFFVLAGANLHISKIPSLGLIGIVYIVARSAGLIGGSKLGALIGGANKKIRKYLGLGILSQAGVAIGLALSIKKDLTGIGQELASGITNGTHIGAAALTTITVTAVFFEFVGPILTKYGLEKAGEINEDI